MAAEHVGYPTYNVVFNNQNMVVEGSTFENVYNYLRNYMTSTMNGNGVSVVFNNTTYSIDSTKYNNTRNNLYTHLEGCTSGNKKIVLNGKEFNVSYKSDNISELKGNMSAGSSDSDSAGHGSVPR